jgi:trans-aconitate methyltransferase
MEESKFNIEQPTFYGSTQLGDYNKMWVKNSQPSKTLAEAAAEIQQLLEQLSQTYPTNTTTEKMVVATAAIQHIENNSKLYQRVLSALKAGGIQALGQFLNHPAASFVIGALEDWQKSKDS